MPKYSEKSLRELNSADSDLQIIFHEVIKIIDCTILEGHRDQTRQELAYQSGRSKVRWPKGNHNQVPSKAVDVAPWPIDWSDKTKTLARFYFLAGVVKGIAHQHGITIRYGGDWDSDNQFDDQTFDDLVHYEIVRD